MTPRLCIAATMLAAAATVAVAGHPAHRDEAVEALSGRVIDPVEGVWRWPDDGAEIAVIARTADTYSIVAIHTNNCHPAPGTEIGRLRATARSGRYLASIATQIAGGMPSSHRDFIVDVTDPSRLSLTPVRRGLKVDLWRLLPYLFRVSVRRGESNTDGLDGALRVYPQSLTGKPIEL